MSTTSTNFSLVLATTSDTVNVVTQIANNFATVDSVMSVAHTGTGELKQGLVLTNPVIINPNLSGTMTSGTIVATTGRFQTITATGGVITANTFAIGTYSLPSTIGTTSEVLVVVTGNAVWAANAPGTGANVGLSNLTTVAFNTSLNTFSAGFVTANRVIATSGALTGLTTLQATTGTFTGNLAVTGTINANVINVTGGAFTAGSLSIGTYALPSTIGSTGQLLTVTTGNVVFLSNSAANIALTNLASVVINTNLNTFSAGFVTVNRILATSGALTGLTVFQATTGTFAGNVTITGTVTANVINVTGGAITATSFSIGTYSYPATVGSTSQVLTVTTGNAQWVTPSGGTDTKAYFYAFATGTDADVGIGATTSASLHFSKELFDSASIYNTGTTADQVVVTASGYYIFGGLIKANFNVLSSASAVVYLKDSAGGKNYDLARVGSQGTGAFGLAGQVLVVATSGGVFGLYVSNEGTNSTLSLATGTALTYFYGYKIPDS